MDILGLLLIGAIAAVVVTLRFAAQRQRVQILLSLYGLYAGDSNWRDLLTIRVDVRSELPTASEEAILEVVNGLCYLRLATSRPIGEVSGNAHQTEWQFHFLVFPTRRRKFKLALGR